MDNISGLPDELLVRILSFVPTKVAVSTSILSNRWRFLWMWLPKLDYTDRDHSLYVLRYFISKSLKLHRAPVIESLRLSLCEAGFNIKPLHINLWVATAVCRRIRELDISYSSNRSGNMFPSSLFACKSLLILKLRFVTLMDVPSMVCLPSLKTLQLESVKYADEESFQALLSICPVLEDLDVFFREFTVAVPSLQKLSLHISYYWHKLERYGIDTPSLEYLKLGDWNENLCSFKSMPKLREAHLVVDPFPLKSVIGSVTSVKHLTVCSMDVYGDGIVFDKLEHLKLCVCTEDSSNLLAKFLKDSPNLRVLDILVLDSHHVDLRTNEMVNWNQPSCVPECMLSLQILNWSQYFGRPQDREIAVYILKNARHLRTATFPAIPKMIKELTLSSRASSTCELVFVE